MSDENVLTGPWDNITVALKEVNETIRKALAKATQRNLRMMEATLVKHLQNQDLGWPALGPVYKKWKEKHKLSNQILIATSVLMNSITTQVFGNGIEGFTGVLRQTRGGVGPKRGASGKFVKGKRPRPVLIMAVHEFGLGRNKKRPLFTPSFNEKGDEMVKVYVDAVEKALNELIHGGK